MKKLIKIFIFLIIILTIVLLYKIFNAKSLILKQIYPINYSEYVEKYSNEFNLDPLLIYSIIKVESNFDSSVKSSSGAVGLMQIMNETADEIALKLNLNIKNGYDLYDIETNIMLGTKYFSDLLKKYDDNKTIALIAYNAGIGNVDKWIKEGIIKEDGSDIQNIPFKETNNYVRKILRDYEIYKKLYNNI